MKALILVGGFGTRLRPLTLSCPKPLVEFCNKPMILHQIEALARVGVTEVVLAINYQPEKMHAFIADKESELGIKITISRETEPMGTAGPIKLAEEHLNDGEPFFVLNSDVSCNYPFEEMIKFQQKTGAAGVLLATGVSEPSKFGVIVYDDNGKIERFVEKPQKFISRWINAGLYYLTPSVFDRIELRPTSIEKEVFPVLAAEGLLYVLELDGFWADVGQPADYLAGTALYLASQRANKSERLAAGPSFVGNVLVDPTATIGEGCLIGPDVVIGPGCVIADGVRLRGSTLLPGASVGSHSWVSNSIIGWRSKIGQWVRLENNSVLGEEVTINSELYVNECVVLPNKTVSRDLSTKQIVL
jgi:mannose-1-phosphate guanylyltransferase